MVRELATGLLHRCARGAGRSRRDLSPRAAPGLFPAGKRPSNPNHRLSGRRSGPRSVPGPSLNDCDRRHCPQHLAIHRTRHDLTAATIGQPQQVALGPAQHRSGIQPWPRKRLSLRRPGGPGFGFLIRSPGADKKYCCRWGAGRHRGTPPPGCRQGPRSREFTASSWPAAQSRFNPTIRLKHSAWRIMPQAFSLDNELVCQRGSAPQLCSPTNASGLRQTLYGGVMPFASKTGRAAGPARKSSRARA